MKGVNKLTHSWFKHATDTSKYYGEERVDNALRYSQDSDKKKRKEKGECKYCFYFYSSRIGGSAMTDYNCGICNKEEMSNSTHCSKVCKDCSIKYEICCECGGDVEQRARKKPTFTELK